MVKVMEANSSIGSSCFSILRFATYVNSEVDTNQLGFGQKLLSDTKLT